jgi:hypothetical protein
MIRFLSELYCLISFLSELYCLIGFLSELFRLISFLSELCWSIDFLSAQLVDRFSLKSTGWRLIDSCKEDIEFSSYLSYIYGRLSFWGNYYVPLLAAAMRGISRD